MARAPSAPRAGSGADQPTEDVRQQLADYCLELANADTCEECRGEDTIYTFTRRFGTKGGGRRRRSPDVVSILRAVPTRDLRVFELNAALLLPDRTLDIDATQRALGRLKQLGKT